MNAPWPSTVSPLCATWPAHPKLPDQASTRKGLQPLHDTADPCVHCGMDLNRGDGSSPRPGRCQESGEVAYHHVVLRNTRLWLASISPPGGMGHLNHSARLTHSSPASESHDSSSPHLRPLGGGASHLAVVSWAWAIARSPTLARAISA